MTKERVNLETPGYRYLDGERERLLAELRASRKVVEAAKALVVTWGDSLKDMAGDGPEEAALRLALKDCYGD